MNFSEELKRRTAEVEEIVLKYLPAKEGMQKTIFESMDYSVEVGGKRLRPMMMREFYRLFGGTGEVIEPFMAAMEMIHSSSLVHDDLPCMDNDTLRRGKPTTWSKYGEDMGVLAGDALMLYAFETAVKAGAFARDAELRAVLRGVEVLAQVSGVYGMVGGQTVDVELTGKPMTKEQLQFVFREKTGALLRGTCTIGAILAGADETQIAKVSEIANAVGMAFQIKDDLLDLTSTTEQLGKPVGSDERNEKNTYVSLYGFEEAERMVTVYSENAIEGLKNLEKEYGLQEDGFLSELIRQLIVREK